MSKIIVEDQTAQVSVQDDNINILEEEVFYTASLMGARLGMGAHDIALVLAYLAEDMLAYLKTMGTITQEDENKIRPLALEYAKAKQAKLEESGAMGKIKQMVDAVKASKMEKKS